MAENLLTRGQVAKMLGKPVSLIRFVVTMYGIPMRVAGSRDFIEPGSVDQIRAAIADYESKLSPVRRGRPPKSKTAV